MKMKFKNVYKCIIFALTLLPSIVFSQTIGNERIIDVGQNVADTNKKKSNTIEFGGNMDFVSNGFGRWDAARVRYTRANDKYTWFIEANGYDRSESGGAAFAPVAGIYVDWNKNWYTFTSLSTSTNSDYTPVIRADQDVNYKFGKTRQWVAVLGGTYIDYYTPQSAVIASAGMSYYGKGFMISSRFFYNISYPGALSSVSGLLSVDQGHWYRYMNTLSISGGKQAYMATYLESPEAINRNSITVFFRHRHWIGKTWGFWGQISYSKVFDAYDAPGAGIGLFVHF